MTLRLADLLRTTAFRWSAVVAATFTGLSLVLFGFIYWQTVGYEARELDAITTAEARSLALAASSDAAAHLQGWLAADEHHVRYGMLLAPDGRLVLGNIAALPAGLPLDGRPHFVSDILVAGADDNDGDEREEAMRGVGIRLADGGAAVVGFDTDELVHTEAVLIRAVGLGLIPMVALRSSAAGFLAGVPSTMWRPWTGRSPVSRTAISQSGFRCAARMIRCLAHRKCSNYEIDMKVPQELSRRVPQSVDH